jgi:DNA-binding SARP family transcriptional activator
VLAKVRVPEVRALRLDRLEGRLAAVWERRLGVVIAPAGSGKTTLLAGYASSLNVPVAWYRAESWDARTPSLLRHLQSAIGAAVEGTAEPPLDGAVWSSVEEAAAALDAWRGSRLLLVVDDLHALESTDAEASLERLVDYLPERVAAIMASRNQPGFNLSRRRLEGTLLEVTSDDLRFRSWEVERLFRDVYGLAIPPQELAALARRTEGWAAGLQLFRLAIEGKSADERRRLLQEGGSSSRFLREYLARNVLAELPSDLRAFLVETCVLGRLSGHLCDALLDRSGSASVLEELERRQIFTTQHDDGSFRYHEVFRTHLEALLIETYGEAATRERYEHAGRLLLAQEDVGEALIAFARAANWQAVERLVHSRGERLVEHHPPSVWLDALPAAFARNDPWLMLASARRARDEGRWTEASAAFHAAETAFRSSEGAAIARRERASVLLWVDVRTAAPSAADGPSLLRAAVTRDPQAVRSAAAVLTGPWRALVRGAATLLAGRPDEARAELEAVVGDPTASPALAEGASLLAAFATALPGTPPEPDKTARSLADKRSANAWLERIARVIAVFAPGGGGPDALELRGLQAACRDAGDPWGEVAIGLVEGCAASSGGDADVDLLDRLEATATVARRMGAGVLEAWALALATIVARRIGDPRAADLARATEAAGRSAACRAPAEFVARPFLASSAPAAGPAEARAVRRSPSRASSVGIRCFGEFSIEIDGRPLAHTAIRPRARSVLYFLTVHAGEAVHREVIEAAIWPSEATGAAAARLQVAISSIRHLLQADPAASRAIRIDRDRETYRLVVTDDADLDIRWFEDAVARARIAVDDGDPAGAAALVERAVLLYRGPLLVEEGPAEWVLEPRERYRARAVEAIELQASLALLRHDPAAAVTACTAGFAVERYHDPFWRLLIEAREMAGDRGAALRAEADYRGMLAQLGAAPATTAVSGR